MCSWLYVVVVLIVIVVVAVVVDVFYAVITAEESRKTAIHTHSPSLMQSYRRSGRLSAMVSGVNQSGWRAGASR